LRATLAGYPELLAHLDRPGPVDAVPLGVDKRVARQGTFTGGAGGGAVIEGGRRGRRKRHKR
jgi:hypothetical protein